MFWPISGKMSRFRILNRNNQNQTAAQKLEPPCSFVLSVRGATCHGYAVGLSADISTASAFPIASLVVSIVYQIFLVIGEEILNIHQKYFDRMHKKRTAKIAVLIVSGWIRVTQQKQQRQRQGKNTDGPGIHRLSGAEHKHQASDRQRQRTHHRHIPADILCKLPGRL